MLLNHSSFLGATVPCAKRITASSCGGAALGAGAGAEDDDEEDEDEKDAGASTAAGAAAAGLESAEEDSEEGGGSIGGLMAVKGRRCSEEIKLEKVLWGCKGSRVRARKNASRTVGREKAHMNQ